MAERLALLRAAPLMHPAPQGIPGVAEIVARAVEARIFPGAVVLVARGGEVIHRAAYGTTMYDWPGSRPATPETIYDIASLTKVVTATAALRLWEAGAIGLDRPAADYLPELAARSVTVRHLLTHTSGLDLRLSAAARAGADSLLREALAAPQRAPAGSAAAYVNINTLLVGQIVGRVWGGPLERAVEELVTGPLGMRRTRFRPPAEWRDQIAPTELDEEWRGGLVHGSVHDESAHALGGVAGHAGLFSDADDMLRFCEAWLAGGGGLLREPTVAEATRDQTPGLQLACGLGWMVDRPNFMGSAPAGSYGHTGFTGPAIVAVPARHLAVVILSNRTFPRRGAPAHHPVSAAIVGAALAAV